MSLIARLEAFLLEHPGEWFDLRVLADVGGFYAVRTRLSDLRRHRGMRITNRKRTVRRGRFRYVVSEYRFEPEPAAKDIRRQADSQATLFEHRSDASFV